MPELVLQPAPVRMKRRPCRSTKSSRLLHSAMRSGYPCKSDLASSPSTSCVNPHLLEPAFFAHEKARALVGVTLYMLTGIAGRALSPTLALLIFLALPVFYA